MENETLPVMETILTLVNGFSLISLVFAIYIAISGFYGWGDVITVILLLLELILIIISIPFLVKTIRRYRGDLWYYRVIPYFTVTIIILVSCVLVILFIHGVANIVFTVLVLGINLIPVGIEIKYLDNGKLLSF